MSRKSQTPKSGMLRTLRARAQSVTMHVTEEDDWDTDVPNVKFSRIIAVVVLLHVIAVGGILAFNRIGKKDDSAERQVAATPKAQRAGELNRTSLSPEAPRAPKIGDASVRGLRHWRVKSGDNLMSIARQFSVPVQELEKINGLGAGAALYPGLILYIPNNTITANTSDDMKAVIENQTSGRVVANNRPAGGAGAGTVQVAMNPAVLEVVPRAEPVNPAPPTPVVHQAPKPDSPAVATGTAQTTVSNPNVTAMIEIYTIKPGDTAYSLGRRFGISHEKLLQLNGIKDARTLRVDQQIKVPVPTR